MTVKERVSEKKGAGKTVLVGICLDGNGRDLLNWALGKVAGTGDRVVALHVQQNSATDDACPKENPSSYTLEKALKDYLAVYDGFCILTNVQLIGQICHGSSIGKVLVNEAKAHSATTLVVGTSKHTTAPWSSVSLAKHCAKKLPSTTSILAVDNGKVIFQRTAAKEPSGPIGYARSSLLNLLRPSFGVGYNGTSNAENSELPDCLHESEFNLVGCSPDIVVTLPEKQTVIHSEGDEEGGLPVMAKNTADIETLDPDDKNSFKLVQGMNVEVPSSPISVLVRKLPEFRPGWPLLRKAVSANIESLCDTDARKMSVVQWVMNLSSRYLPITPLYHNPDNPGNQFGRKHDGIAEVSGGDYKELFTLLASKSSNCKWFSYKEVQTFTCLFSSENLIGKGGCGQVYKGSLSNGQSIAVKVQRSSDIMWKNFLLEVDILTSLQHKHVVSLIGVCVTDYNLFTVYNYLSEGTLEENVQGGRGKSVLRWDVRFRVAVEIAEALDYLQNGCLRSVIHRDIKSSNILLSENYEPVLSDFGLALWAPQPPTYAADNDVLGTFGYLAPEYIMYGKVSDKIDIYSFGVVLLELITGRKPISNDSPKGKESLVMWAMPMMEKGDWMDLIDPTLGKEHDASQVKRMVLAASLCTRRTPHLRPPISKILELLKSNEDSVEWPACRDAPGENPDELEAESYNDPDSSSPRLYFDALEEEEDA